MHRFAHMLLLAAVASGSEWNYDRCSSEGPVDWSGSCQTQANLQSPINLCGATTLTSPPTLTATGYSTANPVTGVNNGHTLQFNNGASPAPSLNAGNIAQTVGRGTNTNQTWTFAQVHLHWGRTGKNSEGSEHYMQGVQYPLEAHLVHFNAAYGNATYASTQSDGLLVIGVLFQIGQSDVNIIQQFSNAASTLTQTATSLGTNVYLSDLFDGTGTFYAYAGSLTTPGCNAVVTWMVSTALKTVSTATLNKIKAASSSPAVSSGSGDASKLISKNGNFRPLQTQSRTVYLTGGTSASCTSPTEPTWQCAPSAAFMATPSHFLHFICVLCAIFVVRQ